MKRLNFVSLIAVVLVTTLLGLSWISTGAAMSGPGNPTPGEIVVGTPAPPPEMPTAMPLSLDSALSSSCEVIVDDLDSGFQLYGPSNYWYQSGSGDTTYNGHAYWTHCTETWQGPSYNNWAKWIPNLPESGTWEVLAYIPRVSTGHYDTTRARYQIHTASGDYVVEVNQQNNARWFSLGTYTFNAGTSGYVRLEDVTPDWDQHTILFDAIKWNRCQSNRLCGQVQCDIGPCGGMPFIECGTLRLFAIAPNLLPSEPPCGYLISFDNPVYHYDSSCGYYVLTGYSSRQIIAGNDCSACSTTYQGRLGQFSVVYDGCSGSPLLDCNGNQIVWLSGDENQLRSYAGQYVSVRTQSGICGYGFAGQPLYGPVVTQIQTIQNPCTVSVDIWVNRGEGGVYFVGDPIRISYSVSRPIYVRFKDCPAPGESCYVFAEFYDDGRGGYFDTTVTPPTGWEKVKIEAIENNQVVAQDETWFYVTDGIKTEPPAGSCRVHWVAQPLNACSGEFGLASPQRIVLVSDYKNHPSGTEEIGPYNPGTALIFYLSPWGICGPHEYLSTSANARISKLGTNHWQINWEDLPANHSDSDYDDLVVDVQCGICQDAAEFVSQSQYPTVQPGQAFQIYFEVRNTGGCTWRQSDNYYLANINSTPLGANPRQEMGADVPSGATKRWTINMTAPTTPGTYRTQWMLKHGDNTFGPNMYIDVTVAQFQPDARVSRSLTLSKTTAQVNEQVEAAFTIHNYGNASWTAARVCAAQMGGGGFPCNENVTIGAGGSYDYRRSQSFQQPGTYDFEVVWQDSSSNWHQVPADAGVSRTATLKVVKPWTLLFYFAADNDLEVIEQLARSRLPQASQNSNVNIVALWDGRASSDSRYEVFSPSGVTPVQKGELNTGDPNTLRDFVSWAQQNYSAAHYALVISDHGSGVSGAASDWSSSENKLTPKEWRQALTGLAKLDILYMDACLMGTIESGYQLRGLVDYYIASESITWGAIQADWFTNGHEEYGGRWNLILPPLRGDTTPEQWAIAMATSYAGQVELHSSLPSSVSVVKLSEVENVATKASALAGLIKSRMSSLKGILTTFYDPSVLQHFMSHWSILDGGDNEISRDDEYVDLKDFAEQVEARISQSDIQDAARQLKAAIDSYVVYDKHWNGWTPKNHYWSHAKAHGVSIFFPKPGWFRSFYNVDWLDFATGTNWHTVASSESVSATSETTIEWGPMLVEFINQTTPNAPDDPTPPPLLGPGPIRTCQGDANGDGVVNAVDLSILSSEWGRQCTSQQPCRADFNNDGIVNAVDLSILAANWGRQCP